MRDLASTLPQSFNVLIVNPNTVGEQRLTIEYANLLEILNR
jgi:hypothetical protein